MNYVIPDDIDFNTLPDLQNNQYPVSDLKQAEYIPNDTATPNNQHAQNARLERDIEIEEIINSFYKMNTKVNHGPGLEKKLLYYVFDDHAAFFTLYFNICKFNQYFPSIHTHGHTGALGKTGKDDHDKDNYRPLTMTGVICKMYMYIYVVRILEWLIDLGYFNETNYTCSKYKSIIDILMHIKNDIINNQKLGYPTVLFKGDIAQFYPTIRYDILFNRLRNYFFMPESMINIIKDLLYNTWNVVIVNGYRSRIRAQLIGFCQGWLISQLLSVLYITPAYKARANPRNFPMTLYIDDWAFWNRFWKQLITPYDRYTMNQQFSNELNLVNTWFERNYLSLHITKSKYIIFYNHSVVKPIIKKWVDENKYNGEITDKLKKTVIFPKHLYFNLYINSTYLHIPENAIKFVGYTLQFDLKPHSQINAMVRKLNWDMIILKKYLYDMMLFMNIHLFRYIQAIMISKIRFYSIQLLNCSKHQLHKLQLIMNRINRIVTRSKYHMPIDVLHIFSPFPLLNNIILQQNVHNWIRLLYLSDNNYLHKIIDKQWFPKWMKLAQNSSHISWSFQYNQHPLWQLYLLIHQHNLMSIMHIQSDVQLSMFADRLPYINLKLKPAFNNIHWPGKFNPHALYNHVRYLLIGYTDGSLIDDLFGGIGTVYTFNHGPPAALPIEIIRETNKSLGITGDINLIELYGILETLRNVKFLPTQIMCNVQYFHVICDNQAAIDWATVTTLSQKTNINRLVSNIQQLCRSIHSIYHLDIVFIWSERNANVYLTKADKLAKEAANDAKNIHQIQQPLHSVHYNPYTLPLSIHIIKKLFNEWLRKYDLQQKIDQLKPSHLITRNMYLWKSHILLHYNSAMENEFLKGIEIKILNALRAETAPLNLSLHIGNHRQSYRQQYADSTEHISFTQCKFECCHDINGGYCNYCNNSFETVHHYVMYCPQFNVLRNQLFSVIGPIFYRFAIPLTLKNILFVPVFVNQHQPKYKLRWQHRKLIYNSLIKFVIQSQRFHCFRF